MIHLDNHLATRFSDVGDFGCRPISSTGELRGVEYAWASLRHEGMAWWSAIGLFRHTYGNGRKIPQYEERVVVVAAVNRENAESKVLRAFGEYAANNEGIEFLGEYEIQEILDELGDKVVEVATTMRISQMAVETYVEQYWSDLRPASCDNVGWTHVWYNRDEKTSGCYNCLEVHDGRLWERGDDNV
jgi:hypothetical protein